MSEFKLYRKKQLQAMRPYVPGEDMTGISVSAPDKALPALDGGMIAQSATNPDDKWYVAAKFFADNYEAA